MSETRNLRWPARQWKEWHANNLECDKERIPTGQLESEEEVAQFRSMVLRRMARINNSSNGNNNDNNNTNKMYCKTHFYIIWQNRACNMCIRTQISEYERLNGIHLSFFGNTSWKRRPYLTAWNTAFFWRLLLVLSGQIYPCPEGGCPSGRPPFPCETLSFCIHLHIIRILDCFFCLCVFPFRAIKFFVISVSAAGIFYSGAICNSYVTAGS
jgi:hypothetical protein